MNTISRRELVKSIAATLEISLPEAASRVTFCTEELELEGTAYSQNAAAEIERCIAADLRAGK
ncbi:hypothetical protein PBI_ANDREW_35 [Arthrobacter phage Andrew]|uniref:Uncharacterized protein n=1 Tax=Arthrobacter phage Andrew TaxID=2419946 RepID=A0A3G2KD64_9CAUD|nr:hypothetical protein HOU53_gp35 [Arthrobacter phage Andrew]AYN56850.1 hypothetical protein PBI_ANDREW_35 [Arthrobacter phage Andrew]